MARSKQNKNKNTKDKDGKHRKETKEERKERLAAEQKAREVRRLDLLNDHDGKDPARKSSLGVN